MRAEEWARIKDIFEAALSVPDGERDEYVRVACGDDPQFYKTVGELLRNHQSALEASRRIRAGSAPALQCGELIAGRFRIVRLIAAGGMGEVYEATDERLKIRLALKTLRPALLSESGSHERFQREILIARSVSHQNVCRVFDLIEHDAPPAHGASAPTIPCITMELLDGESLAELIRRDRPLPAHEARPLVRQIAEGLQILHEHGVIHRDLKPSNVMLTRLKGGELRAVVMDFGLAKKDEADGNLYDSQTDNQAGAPYFMAPELLRNEKPSIASDIYSLGLVIDELVTRTRAFPGDSLGALYFAKLWECPTDPTLRASDLPNSWKEAILRCLEREADARFCSVRDVISALESEWAMSIPGDNHSSATSIEVTNRRPISRRALIVGGITAPLLTGVVAVAAMTFERVETTVEIFDIDNATKLKDYDYFCKGMTSELMRSLLHLEGVRVVPVYARRADSLSKRQSRFSLDGLLEVENRRMHLTMRMTDNRDGALVWSENYDRQLISNSIELESEIAHKAVLALEHRVLSHGETGSSRGLLAQMAIPLRQMFRTQSDAVLPNPPTYSHAAFDLYLRGHSLLEELSPASTTSAIEYFERAIQEDPNFALAYAAVSDAHITLMNFDVTPRAETLRLARTYAEEAVSCDAALAEAQMVLGAVLQIEWDWSGAESRFKEALRLKPNLARARRWFAGLILQFRQFEEAISEMKRALELDPYDRSGPPAFGLFLTLARRFSEAEDVLLKSLAAKDAVATRLNLAQLYAWLGHINKGAKSGAYFASAFSQVSAALEMQRVSPSTSPELPLTDAMQALFHTMVGNLEAARTYLEKSEASVSTGTLSPVMVAKVYAARGESEKAIELLNLAATWHDRRLMYVNITPFFDSLHGQPGFTDLLNRMKL
jgi:serine/threonine protein kinase/tetratricopeptide (TPR) repeat protein